MVRRVAGRLN
ncbi:hypothetical protein LINGRAPRIM_LOCUS1257 [Linum grandiflorum]